MRLVKILLSAASVATLFACGGSAGDPKTVTPDDLNPPGNLVSVTGDKQVELRWNGNNTEDGFVGYHVFGYKGTLATITDKIAYPKAKTNTSSPRCKDNDELYRLFGFAKNSDATCKGSTTAASSTFTGGSGSSELAAPVSSGSTESDEVLANILKCEEGSKSGDTATVGTASISFPVTGKTSGVQRCIIKSVAGTALANGESYVFFVTAVKGTKYNTLSWSSNFVKDTPTDSLLNANVAFTAAEWISIDPDVSGFTQVTTASLAGEACDSDATPFICSLSTANASATTGIYLSRKGTGDYKQRILISTPTDGDISILPRGAETYDPLATDGTVASSIPGDAAADTTTYTKGVHYSVNGNQVFDIKIVRGGKTHYGKIVFGDPALATATDPASVITMKVTLLMQRAAGEFDYFQ